jgi:flagellin
MKGSIMRINTNISSLAAQEAAKNTTKSLSSSLEKLSTGLKINKASDDASGLAIADKLRTQATSINQGIANGNSAVSLLQIADKSMAEQSNILDIIKAKLIQANTDTTSDDGRESIRKDIVKLLEQLDNIAEQTNYNGTTLLQDASDDTRSGGSLSFQIGETTNDTISTVGIRSNTVGLGGGTDKIDQTSGSTTRNNQISANESLIFSTASATATLKSENASGSSIATSMNVSGDIGTLTMTGASGTISNVDSTTSKLLTAFVADVDGTAGSETVDGVTVTITGTLTSTGGQFHLSAGGTISFSGDYAVASMDIAQASGSSNSVTVNSASNLNVTNLSSGGVVEVTTDAASSGSLTGGQSLSSLANLGSGALTKDQAQRFQTVVDAAITQLNGYRGDIGSTQNQVESAVRNLMTQSTNVKAAESIIRDVDYAEESANFNKQNIISQAGSYAIAQANSVQQNVLRLLQ